MSLDAMKQALHTLEGWANHGEWVWPESALEQAKRNTTEAIAALRERLAQPEQDYRTRYDRGCYKCGSHYCPADCPMPTHLVPQQPQMQPCAGRNCGSTNPNLHSAECFEDYEKSTGMAQPEHDDPIGDAQDKLIAEQAQEPIAWVYPEGLEALKSGRPWTAYGSSGDGRIPLYLNDAVARRVEPPAAESGAGFESLPASSSTWWDEPAQMNYRKWQGLTADEIWQCNAAPPGSTVEYHICMAHQNVLDFAEAIEAKLRERNT